MSSQVVLVQFSGRWLPQKDAKKSGPIAEHSEFGTLDTRILIGSVVPSASPRLV